MNPYDISIDEHASNNSHALVLELIGHNKRVLDVGCASGYLAEVLLRRGCSVAGVERDPELAEQARKIMDEVVVADLDELDLRAAFAEDQFDVIVFGDVLEHLRDPLRLLRSVPALLRPGGSVVISLPHVGHGDVRLSLLKGRWTYRPLGLLDNTHLRFFTRDNVVELLRSAGLAAVDFRRTTAPLFETELGVRREDYTEELIAEVLEDPEALTYQFVLRAVPDDADHAVARLMERDLEHQDVLRGLERRVERLERERAGLAERADAEAARGDVEASRVRVLEDEVRTLESHLGVLHNTKTMRILRKPRAIYGRLRRLS